MSKSARKSAAARPPAESPREVERIARATILGLLPGARLQRKWSAEWICGKDLIVAVGAFQHHVGVEFWRGSSLPDPDRLLEGTGKNLRHVKLRTGAEASAPAFRRLLRAAWKLDGAAPPRRR